MQGEEEEEEEEEQHKEQGGQQQHLKSEHTRSTMTASGSVEQAGAPAAKPATSVRHHQLAHHPNPHPLRASSLPLPPPLHRRRRRQ